MLLSSSMITCLIPSHAACSRLLTFASPRTTITSLTNQNLRNLQGPAHLQRVPKAFPYRSVGINCFLLCAHTAHLVLLFSTCFYAASSKQNLLTFRFLPFSWMLQNQGHGFMVVQCCIFLGFTSKMTSTQYHTLLDYSHALSFCKISCGQFHK